MVHVLPHPTFIKDSLGLAVQPQIQQSFGKVIKTNLPENEQEKLIENRTNYYKRLSMKIIIKGLAWFLCSLSLSFTFLSM